MPAELGNGEAHCRGADEPATTVVYSAREYRSCSLSTFMAIRPTDECGGHATAAAAIVLSERQIGSPACSATMYSAYQSGQFSSCWPPFALLVLAMRGRRASQRGREIGRRGERRVAASTRPGKRVVISWSSQLLPSGSLKVAYET